MYTHENTGNTNRSKKERTDVVATCTAEINQRMKAYDEGTIEAIDSMQMLEDLKKELMN